MRKIALMLCFLMLTTTAATAAVQLDNLKKGDTVEGFRVDSLYLNDAGMLLM